MTIEFGRLFASACGCALAAALAAGSSARAADTAAATPPPAEVVVTAARTTDFDQVVSVDKTGTPIADIPRSIQVIPRALADQQGAVRLTDVLRDVSGLSQGGQFAFGFYDRVISRGLNVSYLNDDLPDGTSDLTGITHTLTGVERVEVLKGPGSALFGGAEEGGTINLVHYRPSDTAGAGASEQYGTFNTSTTDVYLTGPTGLKDVDYRIDGEYARSDGFRGQSDRIGEILGDLSWRPAHHDVELRVEHHRFENTPDATGIPFSPPAGAGRPAPVDVANRYYTPYASADQNLERVFLSDSWAVNDHLTVNLRSVYSVRDLDLLRNAGGSVRLTGGLYALAGRQLRRQSDHHRRPQPAGGADLELRHRLGAPHAGDGLRAAPHRRRHRARHRRPAQHRQHTGARCERPGRRRPRLQVRRRPQPATTRTSPPASTASMRWTRST